MNILYYAHNEKIIIFIIRIYLIFDLYLSLYTLNSLLLNRIFFDRETGVYIESWSSLKDNHYLHGLYYILFN